MAYKAKIVLDSVSPLGYRLTTMEITYPKFIHNEIMTHRAKSRNTASSRAIPVSVTIKQIIDDPVLPEWYGKAQPGMQAQKELDPDKKEAARLIILSMRDYCIEGVQALEALGLHKQHANRYIEPWMWITAIISATEWENFFALRCHPDAQPELQKIAYMMQELYNNNTPVIRLNHLPLVDENDLGILMHNNYHLHELRKISTGRCARVSYLTHDGKRDPQADIDLHDRLSVSGHWSPFEHVATAQNEPKQSGNFYGWNQYRKQFLDENKGPRR